MNDADISKLKAEVSQTAPDTQILYACPSGVYHRVLAVGMPSAPDDGVPEPCECGECAEDWLENLTKEEIDDLEDVVAAAILAWMERHNELPRFWDVEQVQEHEVTGYLYLQARS